MHSEKFIRLIEEMKDMHLKKSAGYAGVDNADPWENFRTSTDWGVEPWRGALVRFGDKYTRLQNILANPDNEQLGESIHDQAMDMAAYAIIFVCLYEEDPGLPENRLKELVEVEGPIPKKDEMLYTITIGDDVRQMTEAEIDYMFGGREIDINDAP